MWDDGCRIPAEERALHIQRAKEVLVGKSAQGHAAGPFNNQSQKEKIGVAVLKFLTWSVQEGLAPAQKIKHVVAGPGIAPAPARQLHREVIVAQTGRALHQMANLDGRVIVRKLGNEFGDR